MARKKIREHDAKRLLKAHIKRLAGLDLPISVVQVDATTNTADLLNNNPWLASTKLVVKPDMLFGQRGKHDLVGLNLDFSQAMDFVNQRLGKVVTVNGCTGESRGRAIQHKGLVFRPLQSRTGTPIHSRSECGLPKSSITTGTLLGWALRHLRGLLVTGGWWAAARRPPTRPLAGRTHAPHECVPHSYTPHRAPARACPYPCPLRPP